MPLKIRTGPLASPATLPAVVSTVDPEFGCELGRACARARRVASAARPMPPLASKDRRSIHPAREERFFMACPPRGRSISAGLRCRGYRSRPRLQHTAIFFLDGLDPSGSRASVAHWPPGPRDVVAGFEIAFLDASPEQGARPFGF